MILNLNNKLFSSAFSVNNRFRSFSPYFITHLNSNKIILNNNII